MSGRLACPGSRRGHTWREPTVEALNLAARCGLPADPSLRVCAKCGSLGRVDSQGRVISGEKLERTA